MVNVCSTVICQPFTDWVRAMIEERNHKLAEKQDLNVEIDPDIMAVIQASTAVSTQKGNSAYLLKIGSKRRRTRVELEELKKEEEDRDHIAAAREAHIADLEQQLNESKRKSEQN